MSLVNEDVRFSEPSMNQVDKSCANYFLNYALHTFAAPVELAPVKTGLSYSETTQ